MRHCERSEAIQVCAWDPWIASSQGLLAMTGKQLYFMGRILQPGSQEPAPQASRRMSGETGTEASWFEAAHTRLLATRGQ